MSSPPSTFSDMKTPLPAIGDGLISVMHSRDESDMVVNCHAVTACATSIDFVIASIMSNTALE